MRNKLLVVFASTVIGSLAVAAPARAADEVIDWNETMLRAALIAGTSPLAMSRNAAIVQASVFDAVNGIDRRYTPIHVPAAAPAGASRRAAAVQAAYVALIKLYPAQQVSLDARRTVSLAVIGLSDTTAAIASGIAWGESVANAIWEWRLTDGIAVTTPVWTGSTALGQWRPTPNAPAAGTSAPGAGYPQFFGMTTWVIASASQFRPGPPPLLTSARYASDVNETQSKGSITSTTRTTDETIGALLWNAGTATYLWNHIAVSLIGSRHGEADNDQWDGGEHGRGRTTLLEHARVLAQLGVAMADAAIGCWDAKYTYNFWRPITAIRETADDGNAATTPDPAWTPMFATPAHPDYPSGHSCVSGAAAVVLSHEFGEHRHLVLESDAMLGVSRHFRSFDEALEDVKNARVFAGIHFRTATEVGQQLGAAVGREVLVQGFKRVR
jgi:hypothetical protein